MGIQGLLPLLKDIQVKTSIIQFKGQTVGIDVYCWLHKGAYGCAQDLIMGKPTRVYVQYVMKRVRMLISHNVTPILVFDGGHLPAKADTEKNRRQRRKENKEKGLAALREGKKSEAFESFQKACDITPEMASNVIEECSKLNVKCIVAPYEADAQLAYLMIQGITQLTISEDSDLLLYGCNKVLYKMSADGDGVLIDMNNLSKVRTVKLASFTLEQFRWMCMLSGCDYLPSIKGMGLVKAHKLLQRHKNLKQCVYAMKIDRNLYVPNDYEDNFRKAELVFKFQLVFDPRERKAVPLNNIDKTDSVEELSDEDRKYAGPFIGQKKAIAIALGNIDPISGRSIASRTDFASGKVQMKATSWTSAKPKLQNQSTAFTKMTGLSKKREYKDTLVDLTPPDSQLMMNSEETKKSLFSSPKSEAEKSLKRLRSEIVAEEFTREDKFKRLYETQHSVPSSQTSPTQQQQQQQEPNHHSAFTFSKLRQNKFRNPFRQNLDTNSSPNTVVVSRFFNKHVASHHKNGACEKSLEGPSNLNGSFVDYLDQTNCRVAGIEKKDITLKSRSPKKTPQQLKIDKICSAKENKVRREKEKIESETEREPLSPVGNKKVASSNDREGEEIDFEVQEAEVYIDKKETAGQKESNLNNFDDEGNADGLNHTDGADRGDSKLNRTVLCEDSDSDENSTSSSPALIEVATPTSTRGQCSENMKSSNMHKAMYKSSPEEYSSQDSCSSSQKSKQRVKLGLSKNSCKGIGVSSFVDNNKKPTSQISTYLEQFKNIGVTNNSTRNSLQETSENSTEHQCDSGENKEINCSDEDVLPCESTKSLSKVGSLLRSTQATVVPRRSHPIGLRRQKKSKLSKTLSTDSSMKQCKLSFDKFAFKKKSISTTNEDGVICIS